LPTATQSSAVPGSLAPFGEQAAPVTATGSFVVFFAAAPAGLAKPTVTKATTAHAPTLVTRRFDAISMGAR
jgi:hypothetical protein